VYFIVLDTTSDNTDGLLYGTGISQKFDKNFDIIVDESKFYDIIKVAIK